MKRTDPRVTYLRDVLRTCRDSYMDDARIARACLPGHVAYFVRRARAENRALVRLLKGAYL